MRLSYLQNDWREILRLLTFIQQLLLLHLNIQRTAIYTFGCASLFLCNSQKARVNTRAVFYIAHEKLTIVGYRRYEYGFAHLPMHCFCGDVAVRLPNQNGS